MESRKKILIIGKLFYPENSPRAFRATELAKEFARGGHNVTVITIFNKEQSSFVKEYNVKINDLGKFSWEIPKIGKTRIAVLLERVLSRFFSIFFEFPNIQLTFLVNKIVRKESNYDLLISVASPHTIHWGVAMARKADNPIAKIWVADCGDPYMGRENDSFKPAFYFKYIEKWFCRKADFISVPTNGAIQAYYPEFRNKILVIPQGFKFEDIPIKKKNVRNSTPTFAYAGGFIKGKRDPSEFLEFLLGLSQDFEFHVYTYMKGMVNSYAERSNGRIILHDKIDRDTLLHILSGMDFLVNFENYGIKQTPSKLIDYAIVGRPILSIDTVNLSKTKVMEFLSGDYRNQFVVQDIDQYRIENVTARFLSCLEEKQKNEAK